jgi:hypothetical protein
MPDKTTNMAGVAARLFGYVGGFNVEHDVDPVLVPLAAHGALPHLVGASGRRAAASDHSLSNFKIRKRRKPSS